MRENHYAILAHLKISYVFTYKIGITFLFDSEMSLTELNPSAAKLDKIIDKTC